MPRLSKDFAVAISTRAGPAEDDPVMANINKDQNLFVRERVELLIELSQEVI